MYTFKINVIKVLILTALAISPSAHSVIPKNSTYIEFGGNGLAYSLNYERALKDDLSVRIGLGALWGEETAYYGIPAMLNKFWGADDSCHKFETSIGLTFFNKKERDRSDFYGRRDRYRNESSGVVVGTATLGYRYIPQTHGVTFKVGFTPLFRNEGLLPWLGIAIGYAG